MHGEPPGLHRRERLGFGEGLGGAVVGGVLPSCGIGAERRFAQVDGERA